MNFPLLVNRSETKLFVLTLFAFLLSPGMLLVSRAEDVDRQAPDSTF